MKKYITHAVAWMNKAKKGDNFISFVAERDIKKGEKINLFRSNKGDNPNRPDFKSFEVIEENEGYDKLKETAEALGAKPVNSEELAGDVPFN